MTYIVNGGGVLIQVEDEEFKATYEPVEHSRVQRIIDLIQKGWTQGSMATTIEGVPCSPLSPDAANWCLVGAIVAAKGDDQTTAKVTMAILDVLKEKYGLDEGLYSFGEFNDNIAEDREQVIEVLELALQKLTEG